MYHADSDILSIVIGILTLVFGACSSFAGKKKKRAKTKEEHRVESGEVEMHDTQTPIEGERTTVDNPWEFVSAEKCAMESQSLVATPPEEHSAEIPAEPEGQEGKCAEELPDLKKRVKKSPKELILFSELMKPKYKEF